VDTNNLIRELSRYRAAGLGGVHIIPIYGAKGWESNYITYLSPRWLEMLAFTVREADRLGLGVDMTTGTGWCFGGPQVSAEDANALVTNRWFTVPAGGRLAERFDPQTTQALMAFGPAGGCVDLLPRLRAEGRVDWTAEGGPWQVVAVAQKPSGQQVKRAAPGGQGPMLNLFCARAMTNYLRRFDEAFAGYAGAPPRAQYHDSYEYRGDWSPDLFAQFERRRGYRLQEHLDAFFTGAPAERAARIKSDYRETLSDLLAEATLPVWVDWAHRRGCRTRNQAHGSPGNWLDLYALADIPETEMFGRDRSLLVAKFASSAAHVTGKNLVAAETGTWVKEHFTETLADWKYLLDDLFLSGVNHVIYHGTCYSPDEVAWPGWLFYASSQINPRNSVWRDLPALNAYATRCQAVLQSGQPDHDILLYWPIHDLWHDPHGTARNLTVHARDWFEDQPIGRLAQRLWRRGYAFDYVSDRQLASARAGRGGIQTAGGSYRVVLVPACQRMPETTLAHLLALARAGGRIIFEGTLPADVPGLANLEQRRAELEKCRRLVTGAAAARRSAGGAPGNAVSLGQGAVSYGGDVEAALAQAGVRRETLFDQPGLLCVRRAVAGGRFYFIANRGEAAFEGWLPLAVAARSVVIWDALSGRTGRAAITRRPQATEVYLQLAPGESVLLRAFCDARVAGPSWPYWRPLGRAETLAGDWQVEFLTGGPTLPKPTHLPRLVSWTELGDTDAQCFAGTARYTLRFNQPRPAALHWRLDLGRVCQSARVRLNGQEVGTLITPPFRAVVRDLKPRDNLLEVEVTNVAANRIRDLDRRGVPWKNFHDINFVNRDYKPFHAADWPLTDSGLLGPVTVTPVAAFAP